MASPYFPEDVGEDEAREWVVRARFRAPAYRTMLQLAGAQRSTMADVMREALSVYWWLAREHGKGGRFLVQRGCEVTELTVPSLEGMDALPTMEESEDGEAPAEQPWPDGRVVDGVIVAAGTETESAEAGGGADDTGDSGGRRP